MESTLEMTRVLANWTSIVAIELKLFFDTLKVKQQNMALQISSQEKLNLSDMKVLLF